MLFTAEVICLILSVIYHRDPMRYYACAWLVILLEQSPSSSMVGFQLSFFPVNLHLVEICVAIQFLSMVIFTFPWKIAWMGYWKKLNKTPISSEQQSTLCPSGNVQPGTTTKAPVPDAARPPSVTCTGQPTSKLGLAKLNHRVDQLISQIQHLLGKWKPLPHDPSILNAVREYKIDFLFTPIQSTIPTTINFSAQESKNVNEQISKFLEKGITVKMYDPEIKGSWCLCLFYKPSTLTPLISLFHPYLFPAHETKLLHGIHWPTDGYYSVPIAKEHEKYLKFIWQGNPYQFTCFAQGALPPPVSSPNLWNLSICSSGN